MNKKNILVIGAKGIVGKVLSYELINRGHKVFLADIGHSGESNYFKCDISIKDEIARIFNKERIDFVYHLGAEFGRWNGEDYYERLWKSNAIGTKNLIRLQEKFFFKMIFFSSSEVYGDYLEEMKEDVLNKYAIRQLNDYAISKWVNEMQIMNSHDMYSTETVRVRLFNTYGPGEYYSDYRSVLARFIYCALNNLPYTVYLDHKRTSTYVTDTVNALSNIVDNFIPNEVYNIAGEELHDIKSLSDLVLKYLKKDDKNVKYLASEPFTTKIKIANIDKAKKDLKLTNKIQLEEGIIKTIKWMQNVYGNKSYGNKSFIDFL